MSDHVEVISAQHHASKSARCSTTFAYKHDHLPALAISSLDIRDYGYLDTLALRSILQFTISHSCNDLDLLRMLTVTHILLPRSRAVGIRFFLPNLERHRAFRVDGRRQVHVIPVRIELCFFSLSFHSVFETIGRLETLVCSPF